MFKQMVLILSGHQCPDGRGEIWSCPNSDNFSCCGNIVGLHCQGWPWLAQYDVTFPVTACSQTSQYDCTDVSVIAGFHRKISKIGTSKLDAWRTDTTIILLWSFSFHQLGPSYQKDECFEMYLWTITFLPNIFVANLVLYIWEFEVMNPVDVCQKKLHRKKF